MNVPDLQLILQGSGEAVSVRRTMSSKRHTKRDASYLTSALTGLEMKVEASGSTFHCEHLVAGEALLVELYGLYL